MLTWAPLSKEGGSEREREGGMERGLAWERGRRRCSPGPRCPRGPCSSPLLSLGHPEPSHLLGEVRSVR